VISRTVERPNASVEELNRYESPDHEQGLCA
jgi:hypothetical protein